MEASLSAHLYVYSLCPDTVPLALIPLQDLTSCLSGLGFVMSELSERAPHTHGGERLPISRFIESRDPIRALLGKFPVRKNGGYPTASDYPAAPPPCWKSAFAGKCIFKN